MEQMLQHGMLKGAKAGWLSDVGDSVLIFAESDPGCLHGGAGEAGEAGD